MLVYLVIQLGSILLKKICKEKKIYLFEDNCESLGAKINNKLTGTFGDYQHQVSFFSPHIDYRVA